MTRASTFKEPEVSSNLSQIIEADNSIIFEHDVSVDFSERKTVPLMAKPPKQDLLSSSMTANFGCEQSIRTVTIYDAAYK